MKTFNVKLQKRSGIYIITNLVNGKRYIGSTCDLYARLCDHLFLLRHQNCHNAHLQASWNKYGEDAFDYGVLEYCEAEDRFVREQYYIDLFKSEYNTTTNVVANFGHPVSDECKQKIFKTLKEKYASGKIKTYKQEHNWIHCYVYDAYTFKLIGDFNNIADCVRALNYSHGSSSDVFTTFILGKYVIVREKFKCMSDLKNYVFKNFRRVKNSPIYGQRYLVSEDSSGNITYHDSIVACSSLGPSKSSIMKHLNATEENPYIHPKYPNLKIYFYRIIKNYHVMPLQFRKNW